MQISTSQLTSATPFNGETAEAPKAANTTLPPLTSSTALFLDFDGTLVDIAPQPELVKVPHDLVDLLARLSARLHGALAIVSGRSLVDLDAFLAPLRLPSAAEHGAVHRVTGGQATVTTAPALQDIVRVATALAAQHPGLRVEIKSHALALHYRHAPELESLCLEAMAEAVKRTPGMELLRGKCVFEIKPAGITKGTAIQTFMDQAPFKGRIPLFAGDDTTDEAGFAAVQLMGGDTVKIGSGSSLARYRCPDPLTFREWLTTGLQGLPA